MNNKKRLAIIISSVILAIIIIAGGTFAYAYDVAKKNSIGLDSAINIAMNDAGANEQNTTVTKAKMDFEKSIFVYDIEFIVNSTDEYDYSIKASDGTILNKEHELADKDVKTVNTTVTEADQTTIQKTTKSSDKTTTATTALNDSKRTTVTSSGDITLAQAKNIALKNAGVSNSSANFTSAHKDFDDGAVYYEIEFVTSSYKYEYEIDLEGNIISYDKDPVIKNKKKPTTTKSSSANTKYIGVDKAKKIALNDSGLSASSVVFTKAKLEREDGIYIYEIEFENSTTEFEYEINAVTGKIINKDHSLISDDYDD